MYGNCGPGYCCKYPLLYSGSVSTILQNPHNPHVLPNVDSVCVVGRLASLKEMFSGVAPKTIEDTLKNNSFDDTLMILMALNEVG